MMEVIEDYYSFREFVERKYKLDIFVATHHPEMINCLYKLYRMKYINKDFYFVEEISANT